MKKFTLAELIISVVIIAILAAIVIPNIKSAKNDAIKAEVVSNTVILQKVFDIYSTKHIGQLPISKKPTIGNPVRINLDELSTENVKTKDFLHGYYWVDYEGVVWGSMVDAPKGIMFFEDKVSFENVDKAESYDLYGYSEKQSNLYNPLEFLFSADNNSKNSNFISSKFIHKLLNFENRSNTKIISTKIEHEKTKDFYLVSAVDRFGLPTPPVGGLYDGYDSIFPISESFVLNTNAHDPAKWLGLDKKDSIPTGTKIEYLFEYSNDGKNFTPVGNDITQVPKSQYLKVRVIMTPNGNTFPTVYKLKVLFVVDEENHLDVDLKDPIKMKDGSLSEKIEHIVTLPEKKYIEEINPTSEVPLGTKITITYQGSNDMTDWEEPVLNPKELPASKYIKVNIYLEREKADLESPIISKISVITTEKNPNVVVPKKENDTNPPNEGDLEVVEPKPDPTPDPKPEPPKVEWQTISDLGIIEDSTIGGKWLSVETIENLPPKTRILYEYYTSNDELNWTKHENLDLKPTSRYLKVLAIFQREQGSTDSPKLIEMNIDYEKNGKRVTSTKYKDGEVVLPDADWLTLDIKETLAAGAGHSLILGEDGSLWAFGNNDFGQLGNGTNNSTKTPIKVMTGVLAVEAGSNHSVVLKKDGTLWTFGDNSKGQLGDNSYVNSNVPKKIMENVLTMSAGLNSTGVVDKNKKLYVFGENNYGQLGTSDTINRPSPTFLMSNVSKVSFGGTFSMVIKTDGTLWGFGLNMFGQLGNTTNNNAMFANPDPIKVTDNAQYVTTGGSHTLALKNNGEMWGWGYNSFGQLGNTANNGGTKPNPNLMKIKTGVSFVSARQFYSLLIDTNNNLMTFGQNKTGALGFTSTAPNLNPTPKTVLTNVVSATTGNEHTLAITSNGDIYAFGLNTHGQLGDGTTVNKFTPVKIGNIKTLK